MTDPVAEARQAALGHHNDGAGKDCACIFADRACDCGLERDVDALIEAVHEHDAPLMWKELQERITELEEALRSIAIIASVNLDLRPDCASRLAQVERRAREVLGE